jgi:hypothetical protein
MRVSRPILVGAAAWVLVVALGSTLVWAVISRAGDGVVSAEAPTSSPQPSDPTAVPTTRPTITGDPSSPTSGSPSASATGSTSPPVPASPVQRTWQGLGGTVQVSCTGTAASLVYAQPDDGFTVEVHERGPDRVEVRFEGRDDESDNESRVRAACVAGVPAFEVDTD